MPGAPLRGRPGLAAVVNDGSSDQNVHSLLSPLNPMMDDQSDHHEILAESANGRACPPTRLSVWLGGVVRGAQSAHPAVFAAVCHRAELNKLAQ